MLAVNVYAGSCADAGFTECCTGDNCEVFAPVLPVSCYCDAACHVYGDCCDDIINIGCYQQNGMRTCIFSILPGFYMFGKVISHISFFIFSQ